MPIFKRMLVILDQGKVPRDLTDELIAVLKANDASVTLAGHCEPPDESLLSQLFKRSAPEAQDAMRKTQFEQLESLAAPLLEAGIKVDLTILEGDMTEAVCRKATNENYDLVAKLAEGSQDDTPTVFGASDRALFRLCPIPLVVIKAHDEERKRVLVAVDVGRPELTPLNTSLLDAGVDEALAFKAELHLVHTWRLKGESAIRSGAFTSVETADIEALRDAERDRKRTALEELTAQTERKGVTVVQHLVEGPSAAGIVAVAQDVDADLLIVGTSGRRGLLGAVIGNTAEDVLALIDCSVLMIKAPDFVSPLVEQN